MERASPVGPAPPPIPERRNFFTRAAAIAIGGFVGLVPFAAGLVAFLDPLRRKTAAGNAIRVASLDILPDDGTPVQFPVIADRTDAWNRFPKDSIGSVYVRKLAADKVLVFNATCPHAGCLVGFNREKGVFRCPCHTSSFELDGKIISPSPSPREMDQLEVDAERLKQGEVWVVFKEFLSGKPERIEK